MMKTQLIEVDGQQFILAFDEQGRGYVAHVCIETIVEAVEGDESKFNFLHDDLMDSGMLDEILDNAE